MQNPIGIIDSGIGGLSVWKEIIKLLPEESTIYLADAKNLPYGEKSEDELYNIAKPLMMHLIDQDVKLIVIACNTLTVSALDRFRKDFPSMPIIGTVPVIKTALRYAQGKPSTIGILSTKRTAESSYLQSLIEQFVPKDSTVINVGTNTLVPMVESGPPRVDESSRVEAGEGDIKVIKQELQPFIEAQIDTLVLGCTHFPFLKTQMQEIVGNEVHILDSATAIARQVRRVLVQEGIESDGVLGRHTFLTTGEKDIFEKQLERLLGKSHGKIEDIEV